MTNWDENITGAGMGFIRVTSQYNYNFAGSPYNAGYSGGGSEGGLPNWVTNKNSIYNAKFTRLFVIPDAWVISGFGSISWNGGLSGELGYIFMNRGPQVGKGKWFVMPSAEGGWSLNTGVKYQGLYFDGPINDIIFKRFSSITTNIDFAAPELPNTGFSFSWSLNPTGENWGVIGRGGSFGVSGLPADATFGIGYPIFIE